MNNRTRHIYCQRRTKGSGIAEALVGIMLVSALLVVGCWLLFDIAVISLYKVKLGCIANQAAKYAAGVYSFNNNYNQLGHPGYVPTGLVDTSLVPAADGVNQYPSAVDRTQRWVDRMLAETGLPRGVVRLHEDGKTVTCHIDVGGVVLYGPGKVPVPMVLTEVSVADLTSYEPPALLEIFPKSNPNFNVLVPCYGIYSNNGAGLLKNFDHPYHGFNITIPGNRGTVSFEETSL